MVYLDNILIIGTTNFLEKLDPAFLRPGRIETVIEIKLPDAIARSHIFDIYTKVLIRNGAMNQDVNINNIIRYTEGMTGSHVERVVRLAIRASMQRDIIERDDSMSLKKKERLWKFVIAIFWSLYQKSGYDY